MEWYDIWGSCCSEENRREAIKLWILFSQTIYFAVVINVHSHKAVSTILQHFSPASACVSDLSCRTQTNGLSVLQRNSLCSASSRMSWFSSLQWAGCREDAHTVPTAMVHDEQRSLVRRPEWRGLWLMTGAVRGGPLWECRGVWRH